MSTPLPFLAEPIPGYRLLERLGRGGFGEVWKAEAPGGLFKAIKIVYGDLEGDKARQELRALNRVKAIRHPYILSLDRVDVVNGQLLIVMELADRNLADRFKECSAEGLPGIPREELLRYLEEAAEALDLMASEHQLQHLDIKPQNLFIVHHHVKIADFGLVKDLEGHEASMTGGITPVYAAPEMFDGRISRHSDQYSLAIVYQELLTGRRPFSGVTMPQLIRQHLEGAPDLSSLPPGDRPAIARALSKVPEQRHATCTDLVKALRGASGAPAPGPLAAAVGPVVSPDLPTQDLRRPRSAPRPVPSLEEFSPRPRTASPAVPEPAPDVPSLPRPEVTGDGVLLPALIVGLGETGRKVLQRFRQELQRQFGSAEALPHLRLLCIDTDPEALTAAGQAERGLGVQQLLLARLNRATHYTKPRPGRPALDAWLDPKLVYRIPPRNPTTAGVRALGRLAFIDNYRAIASRLRNELEACTEPTALATAERRTGLGLRTNRPRVYIVGSLAGGTGGGMFLDLAYVLRQQLRQLGAASPDVSGLFLLPNADSDRPLALANAYAALTELNHFSTAGVTFTAQYDTNEAPVRDAEAPFGHCFLLPLPSAESKDSARLVTGLGSALLFRHLLTPLGRVLDGARPALPVCSGFGSYRFAWPRQALQSRATQRLAHRLVERWVGKDSTPLREAARAWVAEQWQERGLGAEHVLEQLEQTCERVLGAPPNIAFEPIVTRLGEGATRSGTPDVAAVTQELAQLRQLIGQPGADPKVNDAVPLSRALAEAARMVLDELERQVTELTVRLVEDPRYRLPGAEEAIAQLGTRLEDVLKEWEGRAREQTALAAEAWARLQAALAPRGGLLWKRRDGAAGEVLEAFRRYPPARVQELLGQRVVVVFRSLLANLPGYRREVGYCRARLEKLVEPAGEEIHRSPGGGLGPGRYLLPAGWRSLDEGVEAVLGRLSPEELLDLDRRVQAVIQREFKALAQACLKGSRVVRDVGNLVQREVEPFIAQRLGRTDVAAVYLEQHPDESAAVQGLADAFGEAEPAFAVRGAETEVCALGLPDGPQTERFQGLARRAVPDRLLWMAPGLEDVVFYREQPLILAELPQVGAEGRTAFDQVEAGEQFSPHSRIDITSWRAV